MGNSKKFSKEIDELVKYIKDNMKDKDDWVVVKYRDVPKITGISTYYVRKIFELLKDHPNIVFEIDKEAKTHKKPLKFRFTNEEEKIESVVTSRSFYYLDQDEIDYVQEQTGIDTYEELFKVLNMLNYIASTGAKEDFVKLSIDDISNVLVEPKKETNKLIKKLKESNIIVDIDGQLRLILNTDSLKVMREQETRLKDESTPKAKERTSINTQELLEKLFSEQGNLGYDISNEAFAEDLDSEESLLVNMSNFRDSMFKMQSEFQSYLNREIEKVSDFNKKDKELDEGFETLQKVMEENNRLADENKKLQAENDSLKSSLRVSQEFRDKFIVNAEQRFEILLAEIIGVVSNYSQIPGWQKDQAANAKLQKNILSAVTSAVDDMLNLDTES